MNSRMSSATSGVRVAPSKTSTCAVLTILLGIGLGFACVVFVFGIVPRDAGARFDQHIRPGMPRAQVYEEMSKIGQVATLSAPRGVCAEVPEGVVAEEVFISPLIPRVAYSNRILCFDSEGTLRQAYEPPQS